MFAKPVPVPVQPKPVAEPAPVLEAPSEASSGFVEVTHADAEPEEERPTSVPVEEVPISEPPEVAEPEAPTVELTPSKDQLTEENVEHLPNDAQPPPTGTAASEVESSRGPDSAAPSTIGQTQAPIARPALGGKLDGFQTSAYKATGVTGAARSASFNRRILEQQEAVVMPGNHAVDRTAVQFGSLGLSGEALDVDEDREEAETRTQPPQHSPVAQPRASLPPVARQQPAPAEAPVPEATPAIKAAPGLPPAPQQQQPFAHQSPNTIASQTQQASHAGQGYNQFGRYNQAGLPSDTSAQKQYDPFGQQVPSAFEQYPSSTQAPSQTQSQLGGFSSAATDYSSYYTADQRNAYQNYYNSYGQQGAGSQQDAGAAQQRTGSGFGAAGDSAFPASQSQQQVRTTSARFWVCSVAMHTCLNESHASISYSLPSFLFNSYLTYLPSRIKHATETLNRAATTHRTLLPWELNRQQELSLSTPINNSHTDKPNIKAIQAHTANMRTTIALTGPHTSNNTPHTVNKQDSVDLSVAKEGCTTSPTMDTAKMPTTSTRPRQPTRLVLAAARQALVADSEQSTDALVQHNLRRPSQPVLVRLVATPSVVLRAASPVRIKAMANSSLLNRARLRTH